MKILGLMSSHDCSFCILEDGIPIMHAELERYIREKEPEGDPFAFFQEVCGEEEIDAITVCCGFVEHMKEKFPKGFSELEQYANKNNTPLYIVGHHQSHAANAFYSSNFDDALIITLDGGGSDLDSKNEMLATSFTVWEGTGTDLVNRGIVPSDHLNIGFAWQRVTKLVFGLSNGYPRGNQAGTVMAMACMGDPDKYLDYFEKFEFLNEAYLLDDIGNDQFSHLRFNFKKMREIASRSEQDAFDVAAALQKATERKIKHIFDQLAAMSDKKNLCLSGGVVLNSVMTGKLYEWYGNKFENIYVCPVSYDAGLSIGSAQYLWHQIKENPRIKWEDNATPFLGEIYGADRIASALDDDKLVSKKTTTEEVIELLANQNIVSVFSGPSESGRRALGNRSILADPRQPNMKDIINEKVKHAGI